MNRTDAIEVLDAVENGMIKLGQSRDIWQNDLVYTALQGVRLLLLDALKKKSTSQEDNGAEEAIKAINTVLSNLNESSLQCSRCVHYFEFTGCVFGKCTLSDSYVYRYNFCKHTKCTGQIGQPELPKVTDNAPVMPCKNCVYYSGFTGCSFGECSKLGTRTAENKSCPSGRSKRGGEKNDAQ